MARRKERPKFEHKAGTMEYFSCLQSMSTWSELLYNSKNGKTYNDFLLTLIQNNFYNTESDIKINKIAQLTGFPTTKVTKWLKEIYEDIFTLNEEHPEIFCNPLEIKVSLLCSYFDSYGNFTLSLPSVPRKGDTFKFYFMKARIGTNYLFVQNITYELEENNTVIYISLSGEIYNEYRDFALAKARFEGSISIFDEINLSSHEIDERLLGRPKYRTLNK